MMYNRRERNTNMLSDKAKEARREYKREWTRKNRDKVKAANDRYWERIAAERAADHQQQETDKE